MDNKTINRKSIICGVIASIIIICLFLVRNFFEDGQTIKQYFNGWYLISEVAIILFITWLIEKN